MMRNTDDFTADKKIQNTSDKDTGVLRFTMKNDYMFKGVLQENQKALKELLAVLLHRDTSDIWDVVINNPIILGETIDDKTVILDIRVTLNNHENVNIEMQVVKQEFWEERSLVYACRNFSDLNKGEDYSLVKPVVHIGILDFIRNKDDTRLYSEFILTDKATGRIYNEKFRVNELSLKNIENATNEERKNGLYDWAKFFAATTWEELKMAAKSEAMESAVVTMRKLTADEKFRLQCEAREIYDTDRKTWQGQIRRAEEQARQLKEQIDKSEAEKLLFMEFLKQNPTLSAEEVLKQMLQ